MKWMQKKVIGLDIDDGHFTIVELIKLIKKVKEIYLGRTAASGNLKELINGTLWKQAEVVIGLPTQRLLFRSFPMTSSFLKGRNRKKDIIAFFKRQNLPFKLEECLWGAFILNTSLNLIAAKREVVEEYVAQAEQAGLRVSGVTPSFVALHNIFVYNYPDKEKFAFLNIRRSASDLVIYEGKRLWVYPLSTGKQTLDEGGDAPERFSLEVQRTFNSYYLQNPLAERVSVCLYLAGQEASSPLTASLKKALGDIEVAVFEPLKKIILPAGTKAIANLQVMALAMGSQTTAFWPVTLACGLALSYLHPPSGLDINFIKEKIRRERYALGFNLLKKSALFLGIFVFIFLLLLDMILFKNLKRWQSIYKNTQFQVSVVLPKAKILKAEKEKLQGLRDYLENSLSRQKLYLKALAVISQSKPPAIVIKEFDAEIKDVKLQVFISGNSPGYEELNDFLNKLKRSSEDIKEAKIVASTFTAAEAQAQAVEGSTASFEGLRTSPERSRGTLDRSSRVLRQA